MGLVLGCLCAEGCVPPTLLIFPDLAKIGREAITTLPAEPRFPHLVRACLLCAQPEAAVSCPAQPDVHCMLAAGSHAHSSG